MRAKFSISTLLGMGATAALALGGTFGAGTALAAQCGGANIHGEGSSLQKIAQQIWDDEALLAGKGFNESADASACSGVQGTGQEPTVMYNPSGSAAGLAAWGVNGSGKSPEEKVDQFIGTDDAPSAAQMGEIDTAAKGVGNKGQALVIPVAQAAIAMIVHYPANCKLKENHIENSDLQKVWANEITKWSEISTHEGTECEVAITRVVRQDGSGTSYQFKHYLFEINNTKRQESQAGKGERTWRELQPETEPNREWPNQAANWVRSGKSGGGGEVEEVEKTSGSIGYANLSDARKGFATGVRWLGVKNEAIGKFKFPGTTAGEPAAGTSEANCKGTNYTNKPVAVGADDDWSEAYGGHPNNGNENYPICTLTWDVALAHYEVAGLTGAEEQTAHDYLNYVVAKTGGQLDFETHDFREVEEAVGKYAQEEAALIQP